MATKKPAAKNAAKPAADKAAKEAEKAAAKAAKEAEKAVAKAAKEAEKKTKAAAVRYVPHFFSNSDNFGSDFSAAILQGGNLTARIVKETRIDADTWGTQHVVVVNIGFPDNAEAIANDPESFYNEFDI